MSRLITLPAAFAAGHRSSSRRARPHGFTLVELLVVIAIIGVLVALLLPAVQAARESARRTQCQNHLKQIGLGFQTHHDVNRFFPTGGWGWYWVGDPDCGFDEKQPGGWAFNILPFTEHNVIYNLGAGEQGAAKLKSNGERVRTALPLFHCPSRRKAAPYPSGGMWNASNTNPAGKSDYAANCGDYSRCEIDAGPAGGSWPYPAPPAMPTLENGISYRCSKVSTAQVLDGTAFTIAVGEKYLPIIRYTDGQDSADNENMYVGYDNDMFRSTNKTWGRPHPDRDNVPNQLVYGSAHSAGFFAVFCDGSVKIITFTINIDVYGSLGNRADGNTVSGRF